MATAYTSLLGFALPVTGELNGTWGTTVNDSITSLVESSIAGSATASVAAGDWTLTTTGSGVANQARMAILIPTGAPGVSRNIIAPSSSKAYIIVNQSNAAVVLKGAATTGATIAAGTNAIVAWNGTDFINAAAAGVTSFSAGSTGLTPSTSTIGAVTLAGTLAIANGGTNSTATATAGGIGYGTGTAHAYSAAGTTGQVLTANGSGAPTWSTPAGGVTLANDTATASNLYPTFAAATSGSVSTVYTGNAKLLYKPSTGEFQSTALVASNGIVVNSQTIAVNYTIDTGNNAMSAGPVTINSGIVVTVASGSTWVVL